MKKNNQTNRNLASLHNVRPKSLRLEALEDRQMLSVTDIAALALADNAAPAEVAPSASEAAAIDLSGLEVAEAAPTEADSVKALEEQGAVVDVQYRVGGTISTMTVDVSQCSELTIAPLEGGTFSNILTLTIKGAGETDSVTVDMSSIGSLNLEAGTKIGSLNLVNIGTKTSSINLPNTEVDSLTLSHVEGVTPTFRNINAQNAGLSAITLNGDYPRLSAVDFSGCDLNEVDLSNTGVTYVAIDATVDRLYIDHNNALDFKIKSNYVAGDFTATCFGGMPVTLTNDTGYVKTALSSELLDTIEFVSPDGTLYVNPLIDVEQLVTEVPWNYTDVTIAKVTDVAKWNDIDVSQVKVEFDGKTAEESAEYVTINANGDVVYKGGLDSSMIPHEVVLSISTDDGSLCGQEISFSFTIGAAKLTAPTVTFNVEKTNTSDVWFSWTAVDNADYYVFKATYPDGNVVTQTINSDTQWYAYTDTQGAAITLEVQAKSNDPAKYSDSDFSAPVVGTAKKQLASPVVTVDSVGTNSAEISWSPIEGAENYFINLCYSTEGDISPYAYLFTTETSYTLGDYSIGETEYKVPEGATLLYAVRAFVSDSDPVWNVGTNGFEGSIILKTYLASPVVTVEGEPTDSSVKFVWDAVEGAESYKVDYSINGGEVVSATTTDAFYTVAADPESVVSISVTAVPADGSERYLESKEPGTASATLDKAAKLDLISAVDSVHYNAIGTVVATIDSYRVDSSSIVVYDNDNPTDLFKVVDNTIVVAKSLVDQANPHAIKVVAGDFVSETISVEAKGRLAKPSVLTTETYYDSIALTWGDVNGADRYVVEIAEEGGKFAVSTPFIGPEMVFGDLKPDTNYTIRIKALNEVSGLYSDRTVVNLATAPAPAVTLTQTAESVDYDAIGTVVATFDAVSFDAGNVVLKVNGAESDLFKIEGNNIVVAKNLLNAAQPHKLQLTADVEGYGAIASEEISVAVTGKLTQPVLTVADAPFDSVTITWTPIEYATAYVLQYGEEGKDLCDPIVIDATGTEDLETIELTLFDVRPSTSYTVSIAALNVVSGIASDAALVSFTSAGAPAITLTDTVVSVEYTDVNEVVAVFETVSIDADKLVVLDNGEETDLFKIDGNAIVIAKNLLESPQPHTLQLKANITGYGEVASEEFTFSVRGKIDAPTIEVTGVATNAINISWTAVPEATAYDVLICVQGSEEAATYRVDSDQLAYSFTNLDSKTTYTVGVKAVVAGSDIASDVASVDAATLATSSISLTQVAESVKYNAIGTVVATFDSEAVDVDSIVIVGDSSKFAIDGNNIVVAENLLGSANPQTIQLSAGGVLSNAINVAIVGKLAKPAVTLDQNTYDTLSFSWDAVAGATSYLVEFSEIGGESLTVKLGADDTTVTIDELTAETDYRIRVKAVNDASSISSDRTVLNVTTTGAPAITLTQTAESVDYNAIGAVVATFETVSLDASDVVLTVNGEASDLFKIEGNSIVVASGLLNAAQPHTIQLTAEVEGYGSVASETISVAVAGKLAKPQVTISNVGDTSMKVTWAAVDGATAYKLEYIKADLAATESYVSYTVAGLGGTIKNLSPDTNYIIRVSAINGVSGITSDRTIVEQKTAQAPSITLTQVLGSVNYSAVGTVVATFDVVSMDPSDVVLKVNGAASDAFEIVGNQIVVAKSLLYVTQPIELQLEAELVGRDPIASETITLAIEGKLAKPEVTISKVTDISMKVTWAAVDGATAYKLEYIKADDAATESYVSYTVTGLGGTIKNLSPDTNYIVRVSAINRVSGITSDRTIVEQKTAATPSITVYQEEALVKFNAVGTVVASFEANFDDVPVVVYENGAPTEYFKVEGNTVVVSAKLANVERPHTLQLVAPGKLANGTTQVVSEEFVVDVMGKLNKPVVALVEAASNSIAISWAPVKDATGFRLQYAVGTSKTFETFDVNVDELTVDANGNYTYTFSDLNPNQLYRIRVKAVAVETDLSSDGTYLNATTSDVVSNAELDEEELFDVLALSILE